jgi:hypothetical protein
MYDRNKRYRCTIIRGKAGSEAERLVPLYAEIILDSEGFSKEHFHRHFNDTLKFYLASAGEKALDNHRTEIAGSLFGMYQFENDRLVVSKRTKDLFNSGDLTRFFKSIVAKFQFPNCMHRDKSPIQDRLNAGISIKPFHYVLELLAKAELQGITLSKRELAFYFFDSLDSLQGTISPQSLLDEIKLDRKKRNYYKVEYPGKASSYSMQHITEQLNLMELANLIIQGPSIDGEKFISLNSAERQSINTLIKQGYGSLDFSVASFANLEEEFDLVRQLWDCYYCGPLAYDFNVSHQSNSSNLAEIQDGIRNTVAFPYSDSANDIGAIGESLVYDSEKARVKSFNPRLGNKVLSMGHQKGLGYDIQSVWADMAGDVGKQPDAAFYIEVKTTKQVFPPIEGSFDNFTVTRNEYLHAEQTGDSYFIYRVYLTREKVYVHKLRNPLDTDSNGAFCAPTKYRYEFQYQDGLSEL